MEIIYTLAQPWAEEAITSATEFMRRGLYHENAVQLTGL
jgi:hypothetical protein